MTTKNGTKDLKKEKAQAPINFDELESTQLSNVTGGAIHVHAKK